MKIGRLNDNWNKVKTKEELVELLNGYRGILTEPMLDYLNSLIELEFSVIREYISDSDRKTLSELEAYKRIAIYNIYNRAINLFIQQLDEFKISGNNDGLEGLRISTNLSNKNISLFEFDYQEIHSGHVNIPNDFKTLNVGVISLYQTLESQELREAELDRVMKKLEELYDEHNPYPARRGRRGTHIFGGPSPQWSFKHAEEIKRYEKMFTELDSKKELSDDDKREIEITNQIHSMLLEDYGLTNKSFEKERCISKMIPYEPESNLQKTFVKRMPNLKITNHTRYI